jgi:hypothetical protein
MSSRDPAGPRVSLRRVVLLLLFGASACMALTEPGRWAAHLLLPVEHRIGAPLWLESAPSSAADAARRNEALRRAFEDMGDGSAFARAPVPTDAVISRRLAVLDGWSTAVLLEFGSTPAAIEAAGVSDREACVALANAAGRWRTHLGTREDGADFPLRCWMLLLLDEQGRRVASTAFFSLRPGFELVEAGDSRFVERAGAPGDGGLPGVRLFNRIESGEVVAG